MNADLDTTKTGWTKELLTVKTLSSRSYYQEISGFLFTVMQKFRDADRFPLHFALTKPRICSDVHRLKRLRPTIVESSINRGFTHL